MRIALKLAVVLSFLWTAVAFAGEPATPWVGKSPAQTRLILDAAQFHGTGVHRAGVQIRLENGWWTYWRAPGSSGMPPEFDWSGSENLADEPEMIWPVPLRTTAYGEALNLYKQEVVFPIEFRAADPTKPIKLHLKIIFGACRDMCIPETAEHEIVLPPAAGEVAVDEKFAALITAYVGRKPSHDPAATGLAIREVHATTDDAKTTLAIRVQGLHGKRSTLVLVEGRDLMRVAEVMPRASDDKRTKILFLKLGATPKLRDLSGKRIRLTVIEGDRALEQIWVVGAQGSSIAGVDLTPVPRRPIDKPEPWTAAADREQ